MQPLKDPDNLAANVALVMASFSNEDVYRLIEHGYYCCDNCPRRVKQICYTHLQKSISTAMYEIQYSCIHHWEEAAMELKEKQKNEGVGKP